MGCAGGGAPAAGLLGLRPSLQAHKLKHSQRHISYNKVDENQNCFSRKRSCYDYLNLKIVL